MLKTSCRSFLKPAVAPLCIYLVLFCSSSAAAEKVDKARAWLETMSVALQELSYQGVFVYRRGEELAAMQITHIANNQGERERLVTLTGEEHEVVRKSRGFGAIIGYSAASEEPGEASKEPTLDIGDYYDFELQGMDRTAGRVTRVLRVSPIDGYRYGYRLWLDDQTALLLKSDLLDERAQIVEQVMFTSLRLFEEPQQIESANDETDLAMGDHHGQLEEAAVAIDNTHSTWKIAELPVGFVIVERRRDSVIEQIMFSDGLASVSVFIEQEREPLDAFVGPSNMGAVNAFGAVISGHQITVVGEVPAATVKMISRSISQVAK